MLADGSGRTSPLQAGLSGFRALPFYKNITLETDLILIRPDKGRLTTNFPLVGGAPASRIFCF
jgi:hypothetical protein